LYLKMIKFEHSIFALPFAFTSAIIAAGGLPAIKQIILITIAMVSARTAAMGMNRIIDRDIDKRNPRTKNREIPAGVINVRDAVIFTALSVICLIISAYFLNPLCFKLSPVAIIILFIYSYTKRFTWFSHVVLGIAISLAPMGSWIAVTGSLDLRILLLVIGIIFWLTGFDILYALQDMDFDRTNGLYSIPQTFGPVKSLIIARVCHFMTWGLLIGTGVIFHLGVFYYIGMGIVTGLLIYEHSLVKSNDFSKLNMAFFNMNGYISVVVFVFSALDIFL
ncbi:MAG: UbiA family prenyltransferase, partial [Nitrospirae bacterium]|nr:UbiA family prenyltransferase [Nitrospirota bacterium]